MTPRRMILDLHLAVVLSISFAYILRAHCRGTRMRGLRCGGGGPNTLHVFRDPIHEQRSIGLTPRAVRPSRARAPFCVARSAPWHTHAARVRVSPLVSAMTMCRLAAIRSD